MDLKDNIPGGWRDWPSHEFPSQADLMAALAAVRDLPAKQIVVVGRTVFFRTVALKDQVVPPAFDRTKPLYRLFRDQDDDRKRAFHHVLPDNTPGDEVSEETEDRIMTALGSAPWAAHFWRAFEQHGKATIYEGQGII